MELGQVGEWAGQEVVELVQGATADGYLQEVEAHIQESGL